jgi:hypothetical protein
MLLETVESDAIHAIGYDRKLQILELIFNSGSIYQYRDVPKEVYYGLMISDSKGQFFQDNIRGEFDYWQWDPEMAKFIRAQGKAEDSKK